METTDTRDNIVWKSKTLAVDYLMVDERAKEQPEIMDYVRDILFGNVNGQTLHSYWAKTTRPTVWSTCVLA